MHVLDSKHGVANGRIHSSRRRPPDAFERVFAALLVLGFVATAALGAAITAGAAWLVVVIVQDLARRLGLG